MPLSPVISTVLSLLLMTCRNSNTARIRALWPTTSDSVVSVAVMAHLRRTRSVSNSGIASRSAVSTPRYRVMCALGHPAHMPVSLTSAELPADVHNFDVAAVRLHERPDAFEDRFNLLFRHE